MDAFPGYTLFDKTKKVLCVMQIAKESSEAVDESGHTVMDTHDHSDKEESQASTASTIAEG
jgi:hypothetical protein